VFDRKEGIMNDTVSDELQLFFHFLFSFLNTTYKFIWFDSAG
jgi:hypothetical protein